MLGPDRGEQLALRFGEVASTALVGARLRA